MRGVPMGVIAAQLKCVPLGGQDRAAQITIQIPRSSAISLVAAGTGSMDRSMPRLYLRMTPGPAARRTRRAVSAISETLS